MTFRNCILLISTLALVGCFDPIRPHTIRLRSLSPDKEWELSGDKDAKGVAFRMTRQRDGHSFEIWHLNSFHSVDAKWRGNEKIVIDSSDIGATVFELRDNRWVQRDPLVSMAPDGLLGCSVHWTDSQTGRAVANIFQPSPSGSGAKWIKSSIELPHPVTDLIDCSEWIDNDTIRITTTQGPIRIHRIDKEWKLVEP